MAKKLLLVLLAVCILLAGCSGKNKYGYEFNPDFAEVDNIDEFFVEFFNKKLQISPETATWMGEYEGWEANRKDSKLTDISFKFREKEIEFYQNALEILLTFDEATLSHEQQLNRDIIIWHLNKEIEGEAFIYHEYLINYFNGIPASLPSSLARDHQINSVEDAENYIERLKAFPWKFRQLADGISKQAELGMLPPDSLILQFNTSIASFTSTDPANNSLYTTFVTKLEGCPGVTEEQGARLKAEVLAAIEDYVYPAYNNLLQETMVPIRRDINKVSVSSGVWELPQGDEYYAYLVSKYTTTDMSPQEVHDMGLREVERIHGEIRKRLDEMGYQDQETIKTLQRVKNADMVRDRDEILALYRQAVQDSQEVLPELFNTLPKGPVYVEPIPSHRETTFTNHYVWPSRDGYRPGTFFVNLSYPHYLSDIQALAFHETVPGHHLQLAIQIEANLPLFRDTIRSEAFPEGWALYAEKLMYENGYYADPLSELGYLQSELFRAARLVIDTGIHYKKWSRREAVDYLYATTGLRWDNEIDRYTIWPGQALSYKVGEQKILELRELAMEQLGDAFDIKEFHDVILLTGSVPLEILEQQVIRYIHGKQ